MKKEPRGVVWNKRRNLLKKRYFTQTGVASALLIITLFLFPSAGGFKLPGQIKLYLGYETTIANIISFNKEHYSQTGTDVNFQYWNIELQFEAHSKLFKGSARIDYPPNTLKTTTLYYLSSNPNVNTLQKPSFAHLLLIAVICWLPPLGSGILFIFAYLNYARLTRHLS